MKTTTSPFSASSVVMTWWQSRCNQNFPYISQGVPKELAGLMPFKNYHFGKPTRWVSPVFNSPSFMEGSRVALPFTLLYWCYHVSSKSGCVFFLCLKKIHHIIQMCCFLSYFGLTPKILALDNQRKMIFFFVLCSFNRIFAVNIVDCRKRRLQSKILWEQGGGAIFEG